MIALVLLLAALSGLPPKEVKLSCGVSKGLDPKATWSKPCPVPTWAPTWDLARSTAIQPCNASGWYDPVYAAKWGLVSVSPGYTGSTPPDCEERLVEQCKNIKTVNPDVKCFVCAPPHLPISACKPAC